MFFYLQYLFFDPPWDTGISPPELLDFIEEREPGRAIDLGCGTGTNVITLAQHGWEVVGVDYVPQAVFSARSKAKKAGVKEKVEFMVGDVLTLDSFREAFDLVLDIGCFHSFSGGDVERYAEVVRRLTAGDGFLLLYAHLKQEPAYRQGASEEDLQVLGEKMRLVHRQDGTEGASRPSTWLLFRNQGNALRESNLI